MNCEATTLFAADIIPPNAAANSANSDAAPQPYQRPDSLEMSE